tara:strand:+ start:253 stop:381 length:129 start_codon:yes stop_codon:yes gene_type:complete
MLEHGAANSAFVATTTASMLMAEHAVRARWAPATVLAWVKVV